jgi:monoterpene epsilon-lactone hydrolase
MTARIQFRGPLRSRLRIAAGVTQCIFEVSARRAAKGPRLPSWNWYLELATELAHRQTSAAFEMANVKEARRFFDSVVIRLPELSKVSITPEMRDKFSGSWFVNKIEEKDEHARVTMLYLHGGGYSFYPQSYPNFIAWITRAARSRTFALDYRLSPEYRFPAQLDDAIHAYRWLLETSVDCERLIVAGDSAGGNLALALLLAAREARLPLPAFVIALSPPTNFKVEFIETELSGKPPFDWIDKEMLERWASWFCDEADRQNPLVSQILADLRGLPPIYIQAGRAEILYPSIQAFADRAQEQGADVVLDTWDEMTHDFQLFGPDSPQSAKALLRIGQMIDVRVRGAKETEAMKL